MMDAMLERAIRERREALDALAEVRRVFHEPHHLGVPISGLTGTYEHNSVIVKRDWYERLRTAIEAKDHERTQEL